MSDTIGRIGWIDMSVDDADGVRDFYKAVVGWESSDHDMGEYADFNMHLPGAGPIVAGIVHARGPNADVPPRWMAYINVADVERSAAQCVELGGEIVVPLRRHGDNGYVVIRDPAGAVCALYGPVSGA